MAIAFERTGDLALVRALITQPGAWEAATDDAAPAIADWTPNADDRIWYVIASDERGAIALYTLLPQSAVCWEIHATRAFGGRAVAAGRAIAPWIFANTPCRRLVASIPITNKIAVRHAMSWGMRPYGVNRASFLKRGQLVDQILLGISPSTY